MCARSPSWPICLKYNGGRSELGRVANTREMTQWFEILTRCQSQFPRYNSNGEKGKPQIGVAPWALRHIEDSCKVPQRDLCKELMLYMGDGCFLSHPFHSPDYVFPYCIKELQRWQRLCLPSQLQKQICVIPLCALDTQHRGGGSQPVWKTNRSQVWRVGRQTSVCLPNIRHNPCERVIPGSQSLRRIYL